jgi:hypothetical protein
MGASVGERERSRPLLRNFGGRGVGPRHFLLSGVPTHFFCPDHGRDCDALWEPASELSVLVWRCRTVACSDDNGPGGGDLLAPTNVMYIENNNPSANRNSILAYRQAADG